MKEQVKQFILENINLIDWDYLRDREDREGSIFLETPKFDIDIDFDINGSYIGDGGTYYAPKGFEFKGTIEPTYIIFHTDDDSIELELDKELKEALTLKE